MSGGPMLKVLIPTGLEFNDDERNISRLTKFVESPLLKDEDSKKREEAILELGQILSRNKRTNELSKLIQVTRPFLITLGRAKAARTIRDLVDLGLKIDQDGDIKIALVENSIGWATSQNHNFLRQALQARLVRLFNELGRYPKALQCASGLVRELKKVDDKDLLPEVQLEESKGCYFLASLAKARASLTSARTTANSTYVLPAVQAGLDMHSGILHAADERDFQTAFSYFYEAFEGFDTTNNPAEATLALKYMLLCKVMLDLPDEVNLIVTNKNAMKYQGNEVSAMLAIGKAAKNRSLRDFHAAFEHHKEELQRDPVVRSHFSTLCDAMVEKELCRLIEPYSYVQIQHLANSIGFSVDKVEKKLSQMILDKKFFGSLHQGDGMLIVYEEVPRNKAYGVMVQTIQGLSKALDVLWEQTQALVD